MTSHVKPLSNAMPVNLGETCCFALSISLSHFVLNDGQDHCGLVCKKWFSLTQKHDFYFKQSLQTSSDDCLNCAKEPY